MIFLKLKKPSLLQQQSFYSLNYKRVPIFALVGVMISFIMLLQFDTTIILSSLVIMSILLLIGIYFAKSKTSEYNTPDL